MLPLSLRYDRGELLSYDLFKFVLRQPKDESFGLCTSCPSLIPHLQYSVFASENFSSCIHLFCYIAHENRETRPEKFRHRTPISPIE